MCSSDLVDAMRHAGALGAALYAGTYVAFALLLIPGSLLTAGAGLAYGPWKGTALVSPVSVAAATAAFLLGRTVARRWIAARLERDADAQPIALGLAPQGADQADEIVGDVELAKAFGNQVAHVGSPFLEAA